MICILICTPQLILLMLCRCLPNPIASSLHQQLAAGVLEQPPIASQPKTTSSSSKNSISMKRGCMIQSSTCRLERPPSQGSIQPRLLPGPTLVENISGQKQNTTMLFAAQCRDLHIWIHAPSNAGATFKIGLHVTEACNTKTYMLPSPQAMNCH